MAEEEKTLRDTLRLGSEDWIEFPCSPCEKDGKYISSIKYCVECGKNICKKCLSYHEEFTRGHQIVENPRAKIKQKKPELPVQRCDKHGGKLVDVYCPGHDVVGCPTCVAVDHSSCKGKQFIPEMVKTSSIAEEMSKLDTSMEQLLTRLDKLKHDKQDRLKQLQKEKNDILEEIGDLREKINAHLDRMEKTLVSDVESRFAGTIQSTNQSVETLNNMTSSLLNRRKSLQEARNINDTEMFVQVKQGKENLREHESKMKHFSSEGEMRLLKLFPNSSKEVVFGEKGNIFGRILETIIPKSIEHFGDYSIRQQSDKMTCRIGDFCLTTNGSIICTDYTNNKLKKLNRSFNLIEHIDLSSIPSRLCEVDSTQLAVTLRDDKRVQFVYQQPLKLGRSFTVGDHCRGIDYHHGKLYVCCGGHASEGPGHIEVYNINGGLLRTVYEGLIYPFYIKAASDGELFVGDIRDSSSKLLKVDTRDFSVSEVHIKSLSGVGRFCRIGEGQLCIPGRTSNNIVLISKDAELQKELLSMKDHNPWSVAFIEKEAQLVVGLYYSDVIKVYNVIT